MKPTAVQVTRYLLAPAAAVTVAAAVAVFGIIHHPNYAAGLFGRNYLAATRLKAWITSVVAAMALVQVVLAVWIYGRLPRLGFAPRWARLAHRVNGTATIALTLPVATQCLLAYGFQTGSPRVLVHSVAGCAFYGVFIAKICLIHDRRQPRWALPLTGTLLVVTIGVLWYSAALWVLHGYHIPLLQ